VNSSPSLNIFFDKEEYDTKGLVRIDYGEEHICPVDLHVKSKILVDLMDLSRLPPKEIEDLTEYESYTKILPYKEDEPANEVFDCV
jgi:hypothetical protein